MHEASVVVGIDGCAGCQAALRYAIEEAARRGCRLTVVVAYRRPGAAVTDNSGADGNLAAEAEATARQCLELAGETILPGNVDCQIVTQEMAPVDALAAGAGDAAVIVVGRHHRETGGKESSGSTISGLLDHSPLPVISVPRGYGC